ncbi:MAG: hypothetical protein GXP63_05135 [DPANN group archaeon]|nr:hypothetical protein [DPANN group archaeon]
MDDLNGIPLRMVAAYINEKKGRCASLVHFSPELVRLYPRAIHLHEEKAIKRKKKEIRYCRGHTG